MEKLMTIALGWCLLSGDLTAFCRSPVLRLLHKQPASRWSDVFRVFLHLSNLIYTPHKTALLSETSSNPCRSQVPGSSAYYSHTASAYYNLLKR